MIDQLSYTTKHRDNLQTIINARLALAIFAAATMAGCGPMPERGSPYGGATAATPNQGPPPPTIEQRVDRLEQTIKQNDQMDSVTRLDTVQEQIRSLYGKAEQLDFQIKDLERRQKKLYSDVDGRLQSLESRSGNQSSSAKAESSAKSEDSSDSQQAGPSEQDKEKKSSPTPPTDGGNDQSGYTKAMELLKQRQYKEAMASLQNFLKQYPDSSYTANVHYWIGKIHYIERDLPAALKSFLSVVEKYPDNSKADDAKLQVGYIYLESGKTSKGKEVLEDLVKTSPKTLSAEQARKRLETL